MLEIMSQIHRNPRITTGQSPWSFRFASGDAKAKAEMSSENLSVISPGNHGGLYNYYTYIYTYIYIHIYMYIYVYIIHIIYIHVILKLYIMYDIYIYPSDAVIFDWESSLYGNSLDSEVSLSSFDKESDHCFRVVSYNMLADSYRRR